jgi:large subunit ribosomal protein L24e
MFYRKTNKKGTSEEAKKKRTRKVVKVQRAVVGASEEAILAKRNQPQTVRQSARDSAIKAAKEHKRKLEETKKKAAAKPDIKALKAQQNKVAVKSVKTAKVKPTSR